MPDGDALSCLAVAAAAAIVTRGLPSVRQQNLQRLQIGLWAF